MYKAMAIKEGFSIMETMIASFVLITGLVAAIAVFGPAIKFTGESRNQIIAANLAQEGVELIKNVRDNNMISGTFNDHMTSRGTYCIDYDDATPHGCSNDGQLSMNSSGWYVHGSGTPTFFKRKIYIDSGASDLKIESYVVWRDGRFPSPLTNSAACTLANRCSFAQIILTDWQ